MAELPDRYAKHNCFCSRLQYSCVDYYTLVFSIDDNNDAHNTSTHIYAVVCVFNQYCVDDMQFSQCCYKRRRRCRCFRRHHYCHCYRAALATVVVIIYYLLLFRRVVVVVFYLFVWSKCVDKIWRYNLCTEFALFLYMELCVVVFLFLSFSLCGEIDEKLERT